MSITGHSMGGHGAISLYLLNPEQYKSTSAFSPICHPTGCQWGKKAFEGYLAGGIEEGKKYDSTLLIAQVGKEKRKLNILIDSGTADDFYKQGQLMPEEFMKAAKEAGYQDPDVKIRLQDGYDHSCKSLHGRLPQNVGALTPCLTLFPFRLLRHNLRSRTRRVPRQVPQGIISNRKRKRNHIASFDIDADGTNVRRLQKTVP